MKKKNQELPFFIYFLVLAISILLILIGINTVNKVQKAKKWPTVQGFIISSEIVEREEYNSRDKYYKMKYYPIIWYSYTVDYIEYNNNKIEYGAKQASLKEAKKAFKKYPKDALIIVHYNPEQHNDSILEIHLGFKTLLSLIMGIIFLILFLWMLWKGYIEVFLIKKNN